MYVVINAVGKTPLSCSYLPRIAEVLQARFDSFTKNTCLYNLPLLGGDTISILCTSKENIIHSPAYQVFLPSSQQLCELLDKTSRNPDTEKNLCHLIHFNFCLIFFPPELLVPWVTLKSSGKLSAAQQILQWIEEETPVGSGSHFSGILGWNTSLLPALPNYWWTPDASEHCCHLWTSFAFYVPCGLGG